MSLAFGAVPVVLTGQILGLGVETEALGETDNVFALLGELSSLTAGMLDDELRVEVRVGHGHFGLLVVAAERGCCEVGA